MTDDIIARLMRFKNKICVSSDLEIEAANALEKQTRRIAELEAALKPFAAVYDENYALIGKWHDGGIQGLFLSDLLAARAALDGGKDG